MNVTVFACVSIAAIVRRNRARHWPSLFAYQFVVEFSPWRGGALRADAPG